MNLTKYKFFHIEKKQNKLTHSPSPRKRGFPRRFLSRRDPLHAFAAPLRGVVGLLLLALLTSCTDDLAFESSNLDPNSPEVSIDLEKSLIVPFAFSLGQTSSTRDPEETQDLTADDFQNGNALEHKIDFDTNKECFAIFFDDNDHLMSVNRLYKHTSLGNGTVLKDENSIGEFRVYAVAYLEKPEGFDELKSETDSLGNPKPEEQLAADLQKALAMLPARVLVVLNGGRIYDKLHQNLHLISSTGEDGKPVYNTDITSENILDFVWLSQYSREASGNSDGVIGINNDGLYTMTNSAYYDYDRNLDGTIKDGETEMKLQTVRPIDKNNILPAFAANIKPENSAATIYVERMVAKFLAPTFQNEVIGYKRVFRPSQNAEPVVIYSWNDDGTLSSVNTDWRIHVLGWSINGREKGNYLFKHIRRAWDGDTQTDGTNKDIMDGWDKQDWNDPSHFRSYWSIDPHYDNDESAYPWQYLGAVDKGGISYFYKEMDAIDSDTDREEHDPIDIDGNFISLRYLTFADVKYWDENSLTISENTYDRNKFIYNDESCMDGRSSLLVGPHLLVTAELYLENPEASTDDYLGQFTTFNNVYCDRLRRFYTSDMDWFRMFVKEFNQALKTQENMKFHNYQWDHTDGGNENAEELVVVPTGHCALLFDLELNEPGLNIPQQLLDHKGEFHLKPVAEVIPLLIKYQVPVSIQATVKDGDGRLIPWIDGMVLRYNGETDEEKSQQLKVYSSSLHPRDRTDANAKPWTNDMRKSLVYEWFGVVDHYLKGYMYYAADIPHYTPEDSSKPTFYGTVRNHQYNFVVTSINSIGNPISDESQRIIPARFNYKDQMSTKLTVYDMHTFSTYIDLK